MTANNTHKDPWRSVYREVARVLAGEATLALRGKEKALQSAMDNPQGILAAQDALLAALHSGVYGHLMGLAQKYEKEAKS